MPRVETFCCMTCRLLQPQASECVECAAIIAPLAVMQKMLGQKDPSNVTGNSRASTAASVGALLGYGGLVAGSLFAPITVPIGLGAGAIVGGIMWARSKRRIVAMADLAPAQSKAVVTKTGIARKLRETLPALADQAPVLAEQVEIRRRGGLLFRRLAAVPFFVELDAGERLVVAGLVRIKRTPVHHAIARKDPRLAALGIPESYRISGGLETAGVREGDPIKVTGELATEIVSDLAFHRDAGEVPVMRGRAGAVVVVA
jgi:hypothetical protein